MPLVVGMHYFLAFALELALLVGFGLFGLGLGLVRAGGGWAGGVLAAVLVAFAILLWARFAAPRSATRLTGPFLLLFKIAIFAAGTLAFWAAGRAEIALGFGVLAAIDLVAALVLHRL